MGDSSGLRVNLRLDGEADKEICEYLQTVAPRRRAQRARDLMEMGIRYHEAARSSPFTSGHDQNRTDTKTPNAPTSGPVSQGSISVAVVPTAPLNNHAHNAPAPADPNTGFGDALDGVEF